MAAAILAEVLGVLGAQERALVMIEPPGQIRVRRIFEIHDGVDVAVEEAVLEKLGGFMRQAGEFKLRVRSILALIETAEESRRRRPVETVIVIQDSHQHGQISV